MLLPPLISKAPTIARVPRRAILSITGSQASQFLNGIVSASVPLPPRPFYSAFLHAQGKVLHDAFFYTQTTPDDRQGFLVDTEQTEDGSLLQLLKRYVLRSKVKVRDVSHEFEVWASWGTSQLPEKSWKWAEHSGVAEPVWNDTSHWPWGAKDLEIQDARAPEMGKRFLLPNDHLPNEVDSDEYTLHRILNGVPEGAVDIPAFPMESNLDFMGAVDFRKGCYVGQELTVRTYHTGVIRKRVFPVVIHPFDSPPTGHAMPNNQIPSFPSNLDIRPVLSEANSTRSRGTGKLLTSRRGVGLAMLRLEHVQAAEQGKLVFMLETETGRWGVTHWRPEWWPQRDSE